MRIALTTLNGWILELVESVAGPNIYEEFLASHSEGIHHLMTIVEDFDAEVARFQALGYELIQSGRGYGASGDGGFTYFDTTADAEPDPRAGRDPRERIPPKASTRRRERSIDRRARWRAETAGPPTVAAATGQLP